MKSNWKDDVPMHTARQCKEYLYNDQLDKLPEIPYVFLGNFEDKGKVCDLYFLKGEGAREENILVQYSDTPSDYGSGMIFAHKDFVNGKQTPRTVAMQRALELGLLKEKTYFVGYSESYADKLVDEFYLSDYKVNMPDMDYEYAETLNDEEWDKYDTAIAKEAEKYKENFVKEHGYIPRSPAHKQYFVFESIEEAKKHCSDGFVCSLSATSIEHLDVLAEKEQVFLKGRQTQEITQRPGRCNEIEFLPS
ncbi:hypothetical protein [Vibrio harveyi]|uniref:hypothetical protein n=1 Tax=Vibrio harveyi TaxID=669 RepID=UPI003CE8D963